MPQQNPYLLPDDVEPIHYDLTFEPNFSNFTFEGYEELTIFVKRPTSKIVLHALNLHIKKAFLQSFGDVKICSKKPALSKKWETVTFDFGCLIPEGRAILRIDYSGELNDKLCGFYRTSYTVDGQERWGAGTQFEATDARRAFICGDEPARKATFRVAAIVPEQMTALSNMPIETLETLNGGFKEYVFQTTPRMSTYLLALVVAELEYVEATDKNGVLIRVWTTPGKEEQGRFALEAACHTLPYLSEWFGIPYPLPKLDMVAMPDFAAGAMENWGLITYREQALLIDPVNSSVGARQNVSGTVDHEIAHQWFGNRTTMQWWNDLWLNEGLASWVGPKASDHHFPEWHLWTQFVFDNYLNALHEDSLKNTHPIQVTVKNPATINEVFDAISYSKGAVVNRMLEHYLGEESFRKGLHRYLTEHAYANATTDDLWYALGKVSRKPVAEIMGSYTRQPGYPLITVTEEGYTKGGKKILHLKQKRFLFDGSTDKKGLLWNVPVGLLARGTEKPTFLYLNEREIIMAVGLNDAQSWIKLNPGQTGFFRVAYPERLRELLINAIQSGELPVIDRLGLLDDAFALARAGYLKSSAAMNQLCAYAAETDFSVWMTIYEALGELNNLLASESYYEAFRTFTKEFFRPIAQAKGWEPVPSDGHLDVMLRAYALRHLGSYGDSETIKEAKNRFAHFVAGRELDPNLRLLVYSLTAENGGENEYEKLLHLYEASTSQEEKMRVLRGMSASQNPHLIGEFLKLTLSDKVRFQDTPLALMASGSHPLGRTLTWEFVKENWKTLFGRYQGHGINLLNRIIKTTEEFTTKDQLLDVQNFFKTHQVNGAKRVMKQCLEKIRSNVAWLTRDREDLRDYFTSQK